MIIQQCVSHTHIEWYLIEHVCRQADHGEVVKYQGRFEVDWPPFLHYLWPRPYNEQVAQEDAADWHGRVDHRPTVRPLVWTDEKHSGNK